MHNLFNLLFLLYLFFYYFESETIDISVGGCYKFGYRGRVYIKTVES